MVLHNRPYLAEVRVCNLSLQRHETSIIAFRQQQKQLLGRRLKSRINFNAGGYKMQQQEQQQQQQQPLPLVEISPFRKSVWRREKSLPDFYERRQTLNSQQQQQREGEKKQAGLKGNFNNSISNCGENRPNQPQVDLTAAEMAARLAAAVHGADGDFGIHSEDQTIYSHHQGNIKSKCCTHPKAEFHHESTRLWRTQDLIPGFITRLERTKTSMLSFQKESSNLGGEYSFYLGEENNGNYLNYNSSSSHSSEFGGSREAPSNGANMKIKGGRMKQLVQRRPLLYLNPLDSYRQASEPSRDSVHPWSDCSHLYSHSKLATRNSFPLTSSRAREFMLNGAGHATYPLRPVRHHSLKTHPQQHPQQLQPSDPLPPATACNSPHKFNSKLGAAKNSLEVLSSLGAPTKLEKSLVAEYEMNLEKFRRERLMMQPLDLRSVPSQYVSASVNLTRGELCLQEAREANRARRRKNLLTPLDGTARSSSSLLLDTDRGSLASEDRDGTGAPLAFRKQPYAFVDTTMHPLDSVLAEESESHGLTEDDLGSASGVNPVHVKSTTKSAPGKMVKAADGELRRGEEDLMFATTSSCDGKISYADSNCTASNENIDGKDGLLSSRQHLIDSENVRGDKKRMSGEKDVDVNLTLDDDGEVVSVMDTTTPVSVGGSSTSRAKTNLEYLHKLRTKSVPRPLQPLPLTPSTKDSNVSLSEKSGVFNIDASRVDKGDEFLERSQCPQPEHHNLKSPSDKSHILTNPADKQNVSAEQNHIAFSAEKQSEPSKDRPPPSQVIVETSLSQNGQVRSTGQNVTETKDSTPEPVSSNAATKIDSQVDTSGPIELVIAVHGEKSESPHVPAEEAESEDEGFASPQKTGDSIQNSGENGATEHVLQKVQPVIPNVSSASPSMSERENTLSTGPFLSARGDARGDTLTPAETPCTRGDSATLAGTPLTNLDTSLEPFSETEGGHSFSADNGDSGVSTTFLTTEDSRNEVLEGVVF